MFHAVNDTTGFLGRIQKLLKLPIIIKLFKSLQL